MACNEDTYAPGWRGTQDGAEELVPAKASAARVLAREALLGLSCVVVANYLGFGYFGIPYAAPVALGLLAGTIAGLACSRWWLAGIVGGCGTIAGAFLGAAYSPGGSGTCTPPGAGWSVAVLAACMGAGIAAVLMKRRDLERWVEWLGVAFVIVAACLYGSFVPANWKVEGGVTPADLFMSTPTVSTDMSDAHLFVLTVRRMNVGESYYSAMGRTLAQRNVLSARAGGGITVNLQNPIVFRLPTLYWLLAALPAGGYSWVIAMLVLVAAAVVAAWTIAARFTHPAVALVGTAITGVYLAGFMSFVLPIAETWAGALALVAMALALKSLSVRKKPLAWASAAAGVALLAAVTRELAVAFLLVGLASTLVPDRVRSRRLWIPWAVALGLAAIAYALHVQAVLAVVRTLPHVVGYSELGHFDPTGRGLVASVAFMANFTWWGLRTAWLILALGTVGGVVGPRDWPRRVLLGGVTVGGAVALFCLHPNTVAGAPIPGYWGYVVLPTVVACVPLALARMLGPRSRTLFACSAR